MTKRKAPKMKACAIRNAEKHRCTFIMAKVTSNLKKFSSKKSKIFVDFDTLPDLSLPKYPDTLPNDNVEAAIYLMQKN